MEEKEERGQGNRRQAVHHRLRRRDKTVIISVKVGHVTSSQVRDLRGVIEREDAAIGVFITLEACTKTCARKRRRPGSGRPRRCRAPSTRGCRFSPSKIYWPARRSTCPLSR